MNNLNNRYGDVGVSSAISYFTVNQYSVLFPLSDSRPYDLVVELDNVYHKVQCKYTTRKTGENGGYYVHFTTGGKSYKESDFDFLWIHSPECFYLIPSVMIFHYTNVKSTLTLTDKFDPFIIKPLEIFGIRER